MSEGEMEANGTAAPHAGNTKLALVVTTLAVGFALFHLWLAGFGVMSVGQSRHIHLAMAMSLIFLIKPLSPKAPRHWTFAIDLVLVALAIACAVYLEYDPAAVTARAGEITQWDIVFGVTATLLVLEITRRMLGWALVITVLVFTVYTVYGNLVPGLFQHRGHGLDRLMDAFYMDLRGIYSSALGVVVEFVVLFILFGAFLQKTGAGKFFIDLAQAVTGHMRGGPAKTAVIASGFMGSISGSVTANLVTTGAFTIPIMKKAGFPPHVAAGIEVAASCGGLLLPPVMGAAAFLIVATTGIPYSEVVQAAALPALMYFLSVYAQVHFYAARTNLLGPPRRPDYWLNLGRILVQGLPYLIPIAALLWLLLTGWSATYAAFNAILVLIVVSFFRRETRMGVRDFADALELGARNSLTVAAACACVGLIMATVALTGAAPKFSALMIDGTGGNLFLAICLIGLVSLVVGMELPITAAYLMVAILCAPALVDLGVPLLVAHLVVLWFSIDSAVTPPVCVTSYVAAGMAGAPPMKTAFAGWKMAKGLYVLPFLMVYTPITLNGELLDVVIAVATGSIGLIALAAAWEGYLVRPTHLIERLLLILVAATAIDPGHTTDLIGAAVFGGLLVYQWLTARQATPLSA